MGWLGGIQTMRYHALIAPVAMGRFANRNTAFPSQDNERDALRAGLGKLVKRIGDWRLASGDFWGTVATVVESRTPPQATSGLTAAETIAINPTRPRTA